MAVAAVVLDSVKYYDYMRPILKAFSTWQQWTDPDFRSTNYMYNCFDGGHFTQSIAFAYDLIFDHLSNYEKMNTQNAILTLGLQTLNYQFFFPQEGPDYWAVLKAGLGVGSLILDPPNMVYMANSRELMENKLLCKPTVMDPNGQTAQNAVYGYYTASMTTKWVEAIYRSNIGYPNYYNYPFFIEYANSRAKWHPARGNKVYQPLFYTDYGRDMLGNDPSSVYLIASRKNNEYAQYIASKWPWPSTCEFIPWCRFVWFDASVDTMRPDETLDWGVVYRDVGYTAMRTDWTDNGLSVFFKSGPRASGHDHNDKNSFVILGKYGWLLKDYSTWGGATNRHSTIMVDGEGQAGFYQFESSYLKRGYIEKYYSDSHYSYSSGRAESLYVYQENTNYYNKLNLFRREMLLDNDKKILLLNDNINTAGLMKRNLDWLLAVSNAAIYSDSAAIWLMDDTLWCRILSPQNTPLQHIQETNSNNTPDTVFNCIKVEPNPLDTPVAAAKYLAVFFRHDPSNPNRSVVAVSGHKINGVNADNSYILYADSLYYLESAYYTTRSLESVENVVAGLLKNTYYRIVVQDTTTKHAMAIIDTTTTEGGTLRFVFNANGKACKVFITTDNAVPTGSLTLSNEHTNFRFIKLAAEASYPYAAIDDFCVIQKHWEPLNNDTLSEYGQWVLETTGWVPYRQESVFRLSNSQQNRQNIFTVQYRVLDKVYSQIYERSVYYNDVPPAQGQVVINVGAAYTNNRTVDVKLAGTDNHPGLGKMRFDENPLGSLAGYVNAVGNGAFNDTTCWILGNAVVEDGFLHLLGSYHGGPSPWQDSSAAIQIVPYVGVSAFMGKILRLGESMYMGNAVCCGKTATLVYEDSTSPWTQVLVDRAYADGDFNAAAWDTFTLPVTSRPFHLLIRYWIPGMTTPPPPPPPPHDPKFNSLAIDNVRLEPIELRYGANPSDPLLPPYPYIYDGWRQVDTTLATPYQLTEGDGSKQIHSQLMDLCANISLEPGWQDEITLDLTHPWTTIHSPQNGANVSADTFSVWCTVNDNFAIRSWTLEMKQRDLPNWAMIREGSNRISKKPVHINCDSIGMMGGRYYDFRLSALDSAGNAGQTTITIFYCRDYPPLLTVDADFITFNSLPVDACTDADGDIYVTDTQDGLIWKFSAGGDSILCFGGRYSGQDTIGLKKPKGVALDDSGNIWISDTYSSVVKKYGPQGDFISSFGEHGNGPGQFNQPSGLAVCGGFIYVADHLNNRIQVLDRYGNFCRQFGAGILHQPAGIAIKQDEDVVEVFVTDSKNDRIAIFDSSGSLTRVLGPGLGLMLPWDVCLDPYGNLYVADVHNNRVVQLDPWGSLLLSFGCQGSGVGEFMLPHGLASSSDGTYLYVVDTHNDRVQRFKMHFDLGSGGALSPGRLKPPAELPMVYGLGASCPNPFRDISTMQFALPKPGRVRICVYNIAGQLVKTLADGAYEAGHHSIKWDGRDDRGVRAANGVYFTRMIASEYKATTKLVILR